MSLLLAMVLGMAGPTKEDRKLLVPVKDSPTVQLDHNAAYILVRSPAPIPISLFRVATPEEVQDYKDRRSKALAKAHKKWIAAVANWEKDHETLRLQGVKEDKPVEPSEANFDFPALDKENLIGFGPLFRFAKVSGGNSTYLQRVWPGRYVVYGSVLVTPNGAVGGMCVCMGTIAFDVRPGEIADIGSVKVSGTDAITWPKMLEKAEPDEVNGLRTGAITMMRWSLPTSSMTVDPRLRGYKVVPAQFHAAGPVPNYYGVQVDRMTAIPGILEYDRGIIVDVASKAGSR